MYEMSNDSEFIWYGDILTGPQIGAFLTINQNQIKIIASVVTEKVLDQQNKINSTQFDNRYSKNSINRVINLKTRGVIEDGIFHVTSSFVPMIGNEVTLTTKDELKIIYSVERDESTIRIGNSILENELIELSINKFFASHIGIFGNTGSGKSNTLHKLYLELFKNNKLRQNIFKKSQFIIIDFNGEYTSDNMFGVEKSDKVVKIINTRESTDKISITKEYLFDPDILSILFNATAATQVPFLRNALKYYNENHMDGKKFAKSVVGIYKKILTTGNSARAGAKDDWETLANSYVKNDRVFDKIKNLVYNSTHNSYKLDSMDLWINPNGEINDNILKFLCIISDTYNGISELLAEVFNKGTEIQKLKMFLDFQKIYETTWNKFNIEHINPLFSRIESAIKSLEKVVEIKSDISEDYKCVNIFSLVNANQEITRLIPMLLSKMFYDIQKRKVSGKDVNQTKHLIIDEAHNILNAERKNIGDSWQDYRMSIFEEIIKEGRKFGFYLTLSSQRPADISPTILSQVHNYFIHRLVNEKDLNMLVNTMPTLDKSSFQMIPSLGKGEVIITGNAMQVPVFVKIPREEHIRPKSDDVDLTTLWG
ncbi:MAG: ATP-binding protein [Bacilli bacterium]|nr:ATP-binding protein [Bacilli bacterium]MBR3209033.1 ATP-binding protein [Bacilli bacterium]